MSLVCLLVALEGIERLRGHHPNVGIVAATIDEKLNERATSSPGLVDAGDRMYGTK